MNKKYLIIAITLLFLFGCATSSNKSMSRNLLQNISSPLYAKLEEVKGEYSFTSFTLNTKNTLPWIKMSQPKRNVWFPPGECVKGIAIKDLCSSKIDENNPFYDLDLQLGMQAFRIVVSPLILGLSLLGANFDYEFDEEAFSEAMNQAIIKANIDETKLKAFETVEEEYSRLLSKYQFVELEAGARKFNLEMPVPLSVLFWKTGEYDTLEQMTAAFQTVVDDILAEESNIISLNLKILKEENRLVFEEKNRQAEASRIAEQKKLEKYKADYNNIQKTINSYQNYVYLYANYDPLNYAQKVKLSLDAMLIDKKKRDEESRLKQKRIFTETILAFRKQLSSGDDSHCGLVIEVKDKVVQIQAMIGPSWIKKNEIYPIGLAECHFYNGKYSAPSGLPI